MSCSWGTCLCTNGGFVTGVRHVVCWCLALLPCKGNRLLKIWSFVASLLFCWCKGDRFFLPVLRRAFSEPSATRLAEQKGFPISWQEWPAKSGRMNSLHGSSVTNSLINILSFYDMLRSDLTIFFNVFAWSRSWLAYAVALEQGPGWWKRCFWQMVALREWHLPFSSLSSVSGVWVAKPLVSVGRMWNRQFRNFLS